MSLNKPEQKPTVDPTPGVSEYYDEFCIGYRSKPHVNKPPLIKPCTKSEAKQPVGGRAQVQARQDMDKFIASQKRMCLDAPMVATQWTAASRGTHRVQPQWRDPRWSDGTRISSSAQYHPADRDPCDRAKFYMYNSTKIDPLWTPTKPMPVPDVHKLRYMHGTYMSPDDWY